MQVRVWDFKFRSIEGVNDRDNRLLDHFFDKHDIILDKDFNWEHLKDMCKIHNEPLEILPDR